MTRRFSPLVAVIVLCVLSTTVFASDAEREAALQKLEEYYGEVSIRTIHVALNPRSPDQLRLFLSTGIPADARFDYTQGDTTHSMSLLQYTLQFQCDNEETADVVQILIEGGADPNETLPMTGQPLLQRVTNCHRIVEIMLEAGADPNAKSKRGETALREAMGRFGSEDSVRLLIEAGADVHGDKERLLRLSKNKATTPAKKKMIADALSKPPPERLKPWQFGKAVGERDLNIVRQYLKENPSAGSGTVDDDLPLIVLGRRCTDNEDVEPVLEIVSLILDRGADVNAIGGPTKETALHPVARQCHADVVRALLAAGANTEIKDLTNNTPLFNAVMHNRPGAVEALLDAGAKVDKQMKFFAKNKPEIEALLKKKRKKR